jgi:prepilin-type N-terminal cleavage/methylation domain-containing protein
MKTNPTAKAVESQELRVESRHNAAPSSSRSQLSTLNYQLAFTLIELLVVISIIAVLAALLFPIGAAVKRRAYINKTQAEMALLETAIDSYKAAYNFYPPSGTKFNGNIPINPLYYELIGTTLNSGTYSTLDGSTQMATSDITNFFGLSGFVNCTKGSGEDTLSAKSFLSGLKPQQIGFLTNSAGVRAYLILGSAGGPDAGYPPSSPGLNPWRYASPGVNNPGGYDLWIQLVIAGKTNLICNWSKQVQINSPLP